MPTETRLRLIRGRWMCDERDCMANCGFDGECQRRFPRLMVAGDADEVR